MSPTPKAGATHIQYIPREGEPEYAILPIAEYRRLAELDEDSAATAAYHRTRGDALVPGAVVDALGEGQNPVRAWRKHRSLTQAALARAVGVSRAYVAGIETGRAAGSVRALKAIAEALGVDLDDLVR